MGNDLDPFAAFTGADPAAHRTGADQLPADRPRCPRLAALLTTTALLAAMEPKLPPFRGD
jgi:hypothetical protein